MPGWTPTRTRAFHTSWRCWRCSKRPSWDFIPYLGDRLPVITVFDVPPSEPPDRDERPWPLSNAPQRDDDTRFSCRVFEGAEAAELMETFATAHETTRWLLGEERFELLARALFPGEAGCGSCRRPRILAPPGAEHGSRRPIYRRG